MGDERRRGTGSAVVVEFVRLGVVLALTAVGYSYGPDIAELVIDEQDLSQSRLLATVLGALIGYVLGGVAGRGFIAGVDIAEQRLRRIEASVLVSTVLGGAFGAFIAVLLTWPVLLLPAKTVTIPIALVVIIVLVYLGGRLGAARGGDLLRYVGARGRLEVSTPSKGGGTKLVDTSALVDGRLTDVARAGFIDGTLVIPRFVLAELQRLADTEDPRRRNAGRRGLDALRTLTEERLVTVEVTDDDAPEFDDVDAKLAALARRRSAALITVDANLARVAEISGTQVLNLHSLAEALRPPVLPGERIVVAIAKEGREADQGVGYLPDGTMVVVERAGDRVGSKVAAEVASLLQTRNGRMVFANLAEDLDG